MHYYTQNLKCCGVNEIIGMNHDKFSPKTLLPWLLDKFNYFSKLNTNSETAGRAFYIFTISIRNTPLWQAGGWGQDALPAFSATKRINELQKWITDNNFGELIVTPEAPNPNTHGQTLLKTLIWVPHNAKLMEYAAEICPATIKNEGTVVNWWINGS